MSEKRIKDLLIYYISERVIIFPIDEYIPTIAKHIVDDLNDWDLIKDNSLIPFTNKNFKYFLNKELDNILKTIIMIFRDLKVKIYIVYNNKELDNEYSNIFKNYKDFGNIIKKYLKNKTKYFKEINNNSLFKNTKGTYKTLKVGEPTGEDLEFFLRKTKNKGK
jgi:hypothetical protein